MQALRSHVQEHAMGRLMGDVPEGWLQEQNLEACSVCSRLLSRKFGGTCPRCRPALRRGMLTSPDSRPVPPDWPSLEQVLTTRIPTRAHVPLGARKTWAQCLAAALSDARTYNDEKAWIQMLALPKMVLRAADRAGKKNKKRNDVDVKRSCEAWLEGQRGCLWLPPGTADGRKQSRESEQAKQERCEALAKESLYGKACSALAREPPVPISDEVRVDMCGKHPSPREVDVERARDLRAVSPQAAPQISPEQIEKAIRSFPRGSAAGPSAFRPQHLKDALVPGMADEVLRQAAAFVELLARGEAAPVVRPWLCGGSLTALRKQDGGLRPIAVGETWRRVVGKVLAVVASEEVRNHLEPLQVGVGTKSGCEAVVHTVRQWVGRNHSDGDCVLALLDISNAFNTVDRTEVRRAVRRVVPELTPWVDFCYGAASHLLLGGHRVTSARGVQQGDPLGPALFALAIHGVVQEVRAQVARELPGELHLTAFFLDDGVVGGSSQAVHRFCELVELGLADIGLKLNQAKCEIIPTAAEHHTCDPMQFADYQFNPTGNFKLLGAPFGSAIFCAEHTRKRAQKAVLLLQKVAALSDTQTALHLTRQCASYCKLAYSMRVVPPVLHGEVLQAFSADIRTALEELLQADAGDRGWAQAKLAIRRGGLGIRGAEDHASAAYIASLQSTMRLCGCIDSAFDTTDTSGHLYQDASLADYASSVLPDAAAAARQSQKRMSAMIDAKLEQDLRNASQGDGIYCAHLSLQQLHGAGAWLTAPPADAARSIDPALFTVALKRRLRVRVQDADTFCPLCGCTMDSYGDHALVCPCGGDRTIRHNRLLHSVHEDAVRGNMSPEKEKAGLLPERPCEDGMADACATGQGPPGQRSRRRPADLFIPRALGGKPTALDFACTSGLRTDRLQLAGSCPETILTDYEEFKRSFQPVGDAATTAELCKHAGLVFTPMVIEAHSGGWGRVARQTLDAIAKRAGACWRGEAEVESLRIAQRLSCSLHKETARAILRRLQDPVILDDVGCWSPSEMATDWQ